MSFLGSKKLLLKISIILFFLCLTILYLGGTYLNATKVNTDIKSYDQSAYLDFAKIMADSHYTYTGGRDRMPLFPFLISFIRTNNFYDYFWRAKIFNIFLSIIYLSFLFITFKKYLPLLPSINLLLITAFTVFIFRAPYVQAEITYYTLFFFSFLVLCSLLMKPSVKKGILAGILIGLTHLTKAGVLPLLIIFIAVFMLKQTYLLILRQIRYQKIKYSFISLLLVIFTFLLVIGPYIHQSKKQYGHYFYNVEFFYTWYDSWEECEKGTKAAGDRLHYPSLPPELIPRPVKYFKEHSLGQIKERFTEGFIQTIELITWKSSSYGYHYYFIGFSLYFLIISLFNFDKVKSYFKKYLFIFIFFIIIIFSYLIIISWHAYITTTNRYILTLFLPTMIILYRLVDKFNLISSKKLTAKTSLNLNKLFNCCLFLAISFHIYFILVSKIGYINGGN